MNSKVKRIAWIVIFSFIIIAGGGVGYYFSKDATLNRAVQVIQSNNIKEIKQYLPEYEDGTKIDSTAYQVLVQSHPSKTQIRNFLSQQCTLENNHLFHHKFWKPKKRVLSFSGLDDLKNTQLYLKLGKSKIALSEKTKSLTLIPGNYQLNFYLHNATYGTVQQTKKVDVLHGDASIDFDPVNNYEKGKPLQKQLLNQFTAFLSSWNMALSSLDFSNMKATTETEKEFLTKTYRLLCSEVASYQNIFKKVVLNCSSVKIDTFESVPTVTFTVFINREQNIQVKGDKGKVDDINSNDGIAEVKMVYQNKKWKVDNIDFDIEQENPKEWNSTLTIDIPERYQKGCWNKDLDEI